MNECSESVQRRLCLPGPVWHSDSQKLHQCPLCHSNGETREQRWLLWMRGAGWMLALPWIHLRSCLALVSAHQQSLLCLNWPCESYYDCNTPFSITIRELGEKPKVYYLQDLGITGHTGLEFYVAWGWGGGSRVLWALYWLLLLLLSCFSRVRLCATP